MRRWIAVVGLVAACGGSDEALPDGPQDIDTPPVVDAPPECEAPTGPGVEHQGVIDADETWSAADSPHTVTFTTSVAGATLTIERCSVVRVRTGYGIDVNGTKGRDGTLVAHGVTFEAETAGDAWGTIHVLAAGHLDLEDVVLRDGGAPGAAPNLGGTIVASGPGGGSGVTKNLRVVDVTIEGSGGPGASLGDRGAFTDDSAGLTITGSADVPLIVGPPALAGIPTGTYTGNGRDQIDVLGIGETEDVTVRARGIPYHVRDRLAISPAATAADGGLATLTIEPGVTLRFDAGGSLLLGTSSGVLPSQLWPVRLDAAGTAAAPIMLTSDLASPVAGSWVGVEWYGGPATGNVMSHVTVAYAGGDSGTQGFGCGEADNNAALVFTNWRPDDAFITNSTFIDSAGGGIVSGWFSDADGPDFTGNTFTRIANGCDQSRWANADSSCPGTPPLCL